MECTLKILFCVYIKMEHPFLKNLILCWTMFWKLVLSLALQFYYYYKAFFDSLVYLFGLSSIYKIQD